MTLLLLAAALLFPGQQTDRGAIDRRELAAYRLTTDAFEQFRKASARIAIVIADDAAFRAQPLFSEEITQSGDVAEASAALEARLRGHPALAEALVAAGMSARDYTKCALTLIAAGAPAWLAVLAFAAHIPWNVMLLVGIWRSAGRPEVSPVAANLARTAILAWVVVLSLV